MAQQRPCSRLTRPLSALVALAVVAAGLPPRLHAAEPAPGTSGRPGFDAHVSRIVAEAFERPGSRSIDLAGFALSGAALPDVEWLKQEESALEPWAPPKRDFLLATGEMLLVQLIPWSINRYVRGADWAKVGIKTFANNYARSFEWDDNQFSNNQFSHPYHGNLYFNSARSNGMNYYESMAWAFLGSWLWEYHGEAFRPAINDWFATSLGGSVIGEVMHRIGTTVRDNTASGSKRFWSEFGGAVIDPVGFASRLTRGETGKHWQNPPDRMPKTLRSHLEIGVFGAKETGIQLGDYEIDTGLFDNTAASGTGRFALDYGDLFDRHEKPFDSFEFDIQLAYGDKTLITRMNIDGRLHVKELNWSRSNKHAFVVRQSFNYINNQAIEIGGQSFGVGLESRFRANERTQIRTQAFGAVTVLGAIDSPFSTLFVTGRDYDYGPGGYLQADARVVRDGYTWFRAQVLSFYLHAINGSPGDHLTTVAWGRASIPLIGRFGVGGEIGRLWRNTWYEPFNLARQDSYVRLFLTWITK